MKFYSKRGNLINIEYSKTINEIFYNFEKKDKTDVEADFIFIMQEDKILQTYSDADILSLDINIVPHAKRKRMRYNFGNFDDIYDYFKKENSFSKLMPYIGEDIK